PSPLSGTPGGSRRFRSCKNSAEGAIFNRDLSTSSWPDLFRPPTSFLNQTKEDVDARDKSAFTRVFDALCAGTTRWLGARLSLDLGVSGLAARVLISGIDHVIETSSCGLRVLA